VPAAHVARHGLGLADAIHPNTWTSIARLAAFALLVV
jgi:hypothetical protein